MRKIRVADLVRILIALLVLPGPMSASGAEVCRSLDAVEWVLGEWTTAPTRIVIRESWRRVSDATFEGEGVTTSVADGRVINHEALRLVVMSDGVFYIAKVTDNDLPVPFRLTRCSDGIAVFENPAHDAPQRLVYRPLGASAQGRAPEMEVRLEGDGMDGFSLFFTRP